MRKSHTKRVVIGAAALSLLFAGSAFTASNTGVENHTAGIGSAVVSGVDVTSIEYQTTEDRTTLNTVAFNGVSPEGGHSLADMTAEILINDGTWTECSITDESTTDAGDGVIDCPAGDVAFSDVTSVSLSVHTTSNDISTTTTP